MEERRKFKRKTDPEFAERERERLRQNRLKNFQLSDADLRYLNRLKASLIYTKELDKVVGDKKGGLNAADRRALSRIFRTKRRIYDRHIRMLEFKRPVSEAITKKDISSTGRNF